MKYSTYFGQTKKDQKQYESKNQTLLQKAGYVDQLSAGVYTYLPLGLRVLNRIKVVIQQEMDRVGGQEVLMPTLIQKELWEKTNRWDLEVPFKTALNDGKEFALGWSHEEVITPLAKQFVSSYRDLPFAPYQIQTKFRNEPRAKSGIMRGREFIMKDMYSFHIDQTDLDAFYDRVRDAYFRVFSRVGLKDVTYLTFASGGVFSKFSHEFQVISPVGEDTIYVSEEKKIGINKEVYDDEVLNELGVRKDQLIEKRAIEVGNIFKLHTRFSQAFDFQYADEKGDKHYPVMGCYGIGLSRVMGTVVEVLADEKGLVWPKEIAPYDVHLVNLRADVRAAEVYEKLQRAGVEVLWDDRDLRAGEKFSDADLIGIPLRLVVSEKTGDKIEVKSRTSDAVEMLSFDELLLLVHKE
ncbi:MAG TPA: aminoacyl--tRNA ligase-related protein [Patescibacteria group bacterium]|nr:aminoacyl--tRNA ligase-related protein [Patescibacteria group bacterium]